MSERHPEEPEERPGWLYPLIVAGVTAIIGAVILVFYLSPDIETVTGGGARRTTDTTPVTVTLGARRFVIPANYIRQPDARIDGATTEIELEAFLTDMHGYGALDADAARDVTRQSPVVTIILKAGPPALDDRQKFERLYAPNADPDQPAYAYRDFTVTPMGPGSGYAGQQVFTYEKDGAFFVMACSADDKDYDTGGLCQREMKWGEDITVRYAFRGGRIRDWMEIDASVGELLGRLEEKPEP